jgi:uncharacterized protein (DUF983 family)
MRTPWWELSTGHDYETNVSITTLPVMFVAAIACLTIAIARMIFFSVSTSPRMWMMILDDVIPMHIETT